MPFRLPAGTATVGPDEHAPLSIATYVGHLRADADRMAAAYAAGPVDAPVAACPGWDVRRSSSTWPTSIAGPTSRSATPSPPDRATSPIRAPMRDLAVWLRAGAATLADDLAAVDPDAPTWHLFPVERIAGSGRAGRPRRRRCTGGTPRRRPPVRRASIRGWPPTGSPSTSNWPCRGSPTRARRTARRDHPHRLPRRRRRRSRARSCRPTGRRHVAGHRRAGAARVDGSGATLGPRDRGRRRGGRRLAVDPGLVIRGAGDSGW